MNNFVRLSVRSANNERHLSTYIRLLLLSFFVLAFLLVTNERMWHWFVIPTFICALVISQDAARWFDGTYNIFDPKGVLGVLGWHFFFLAPLLFIYWDVGIRYLENPPDWRPWVGLLSLLNIAALMFYEVAQRIGFNYRPPTQPTRWMLPLKRALPWLVILVVISMASRFYQLQRSGGIEGILAMASIQRSTGKVTTVSGLGIFTALGNALPFLLIIFLTLWKGSARQRRSSLFTVMIILTALAIVQLILGGLGGSRSTTVWTIFGLVGVANFFWRPITIRLAIIGLTVLILFLFLYGFFKGSTSLGGTDAIQSLLEGDSVTSVEMATGRTFQGMVIGDMSRADTQSYELYRLSITTDYTLRWGATYTGALISLVPSWLWQDRPADPEKVIAGTELLQGSGEYVPGSLFTKSSLVYGLGGEAMLNFGFLAYPFPFLIWGFLMGWFRRSWQSWEKTDTRLLLVPFVTLMFLIALIGDLDNLLGFFIDMSAVVVIFVILVSKRWKSNAQ